MPKPKPIYSWKPFVDILANFEEIKDAKPPSSLEYKFMCVWQEIYRERKEKEKLVAEYRFYSERRWRADFAHINSKVLIEVEGGLQNGRHTKPLGYAGDCEKYNAATLLGFKKFSLVNIRANGLDLMSKHYINYIYNFCISNSK